MAQEFDRLWMTLANTPSDSQRLAQVLAGTAGIDQTAASTLAALMQENPPARPLLLQVLPEENAEAWRAQITSFDRDWLAPLLAALTARRIEHIRLITGNDARMLELNIIPSQARRWWHRPRPLTQSLHNISL
jgi:hypothetical protein